MLDIFRNLTQSAEEKRQEALNAYLDGELRGATRERFEAELAADPALRAEVAQLRAIKDQVEKLPRVRAPRNYTLDPAVYGAPATVPGANFYPAIRLATILTAFFFVLALGLELVPGQQRAMEPAANTVAMSEAVEEEEAEGTAPERLEAPQEPLAEMDAEVAREAGAEAPAEEAAAAPAQAQLFGTAAVTATEAITDDFGALTLPAPAEAETEDAAEETLAQEAAPAGGGLAPEATMTAEQPAAAEIAAAPLPTMTPAPVIEVTREGAPTTVLRIAQIVFGIAFILLLVATLWLRRQRA